MDKYVRDGKVAVLIYREYGSGWYSSHHVKEMLFDPTIVDMILNKNSSVEEIRAYAVLKYPEAYISTYLRDLSVDWVNVGEKFVIHEYDGYETILTESKMNWIVA